VPGRVHRLPPGWRLIERDARADDPLRWREDELVDPQGRCHPLIGNRTTRQRDEMIVAFLRAHTRT
jgi:hypothetical protein